MKRVYIFGRGHGGTRIPSDILRNSGMLCGKVNKSGDMMGFGEIYGAGNLAWKHKITQVGDRYVVELPDPSDLDDIDSLIMEGIHSYMTPLEKFDGSDTGLCGCKLPELTIVFPWLSIAYPDAYFIHWVRSPYGIGDKKHDFMDGNGQLYPRLHKDSPECQYLSWQLACDIVEQTPKPTNFIEIRYEDMMFDTNAEIQKLSKFIGVPLSEPTKELNIESVNHNREFTEEPPRDYLKHHIDRLGYNQQIGVI